MALQEVIQLHKQRPMTMTTQVIAKLAQHEIRGDGPPAAIPRGNRARVRHIVLTEQ
jgi:hypothetical protein